MHQIITGFTSMEIDHKDGNGLNNTKANLRKATRSQQRQNSHANINTASGLKGVALSRGIGPKWTAHIRKDGVGYHLGTFSDKTDAAKAYDQAAQRLYGECAKTNQALGLIPTN